MQYFVGLLLVLALGLMGCGETAGTGGSGGFDHPDAGFPHSDGGSGGSGGTSGTSGSGGTSGMSGSGGTVDPAIAEVEYRASCLRDEPDDPIACLDRRLAHYGRECGDLHLDHFVCMNELNGQDPFEDCKPALDSWIACLDKTYPPQTVDLGNCQEGETLRVPGGAGTSAGHYFIGGTIPANPAERAIVVEFCDAFVSISGGLPSDAKGNMVCLWEPNRSNFCEAFLPANLFWLVDSGPCVEMYGVPTPAAGTLPASDGWAPTVQGNQISMICGFTQAGSTPQVYSWKAIPRQVLAHQGEVTP